MKKHILLIDKDKDDLKFLSAAFVGTNYPVKCTYTDCCQHATQMMEHLFVDAILLHLEPDIADNLEFVRKLKMQKKYKTIPVVVFCKNMSYYNFLARGHGADHCLPKTDKGEAIVAKICDLLVAGPLRGLPMPEKNLR